MKLHGNASLSLKARERMTSRVIAQTRSKWVKRARLEGPGGLLDRSSAPHRVANRTGEQTVAAIAALRRLRMTGPKIADVLGRPLSTVSGILTRIGLGKLGRLGIEPVVHYERGRPGELIHSAASRTHGASARSAHPDRNKIRVPLARHSPWRVTSHTAKAVHATLAASPMYQPVTPTSGISVTTASMIAKRARCTETPNATALGRSAKGGTQRPYTTPASRCLPPNVAPP